MFQPKILITNVYKKIIPSRNTCRLCTRHVQHNNIRVSIVGATNDVGSNLSILLKQNKKIANLELYDDDSKVKGFAMELNHIPGGPVVRAWTGDIELKEAIRNSHIILMVYRVPRKPGYAREQMFTINALSVQKLCRAMVDQNPNAFVGIATNPINSIVPFASALMYKYGCYNPFKIFGITHIDIARSRMITAEALKMNPLDVSVPVIGGHSDDTIMPLFSNMLPTTDLDPQKANALTRLIRRAGTEVVFQKKGRETATLAMAMAIHEFLNLIVEAIVGNEVTVHSFTANPNFGSRFFSGPTKVGLNGIIETCHSFQLNDYETLLLNSSIPIINRDVGLGENMCNLLK